MVLSKNTAYPIPYSVLASKDSNSFKCIGKDGAVKFIPQKLCPWSKKIHNVIFE